MSTMHASAAAAANSAAREFLTFRLRGEEYAIEILKVREIRGYESPTAIVSAPDIERLMTSRDLQLTDTSHREVAPS